MRLEAKRHLEKANEKLRSAKVLVENALYDDAVSRAYYTMLHATRALLAEASLQARTHEGVIRLFGEKFVRTKIFESELGKRLRVAKDLREKGDYSPLYATDEEVAKTLVKDAEKFLSRVKSYLEKEKRPQSP